MRNIKNDKKQGKQAAEVKKQDIGVFGLLLRVAEGRSGRLPLG